jgi:hypothetical protein|tara:strand:+ start:481 stop:690 length:210 start_codon:yes stop_codon:yes gene_type:complete
MTSESKLVSDTALNTLKSIENSNKQINLYGKLNILLDLKIHISEKINEIQKEIDGQEPLILTKDMEVPF